MTRAPAHFTYLHQSHLDICGHRIVIATPHYYHTTIAIAAIGAGLNVLTEKPLSVHKADCEKVIAAFEARPDKSKIFSEMFNQRENERSYIEVSCPVC